MKKSFVFLLFIFCTVSTFAELTAKITYNPQYDNATGIVFPKCGIKYVSSKNDTTCINEKEWGNFGTQFTSFSDSFDSDDSYGILSITDSSSQYFAHFKVKSDSIEILRHSLPNDLQPKITYPPQWAAAG